VSDPTIYWSRLCCSSIFGRGEAATRPDELQGSLFVLGTGLAPAWRASPCTNISVRQAEVRGRRHHPGTRQLVAVLRRVCQALRAPSAASVWYSSGEIRCSSASASGEPNERARRPEPNGLAFVALAWHLRGCHHTMHSASPAFSLQTCIERQEQADSSATPSCATAPPGPSPSGHGRCPDGATNHMSAGNSIGPQPGKNDSHAPGSRASPPTQSSTSSLREPAKMSTRRPGCSPNCSTRTPSASATVSGRPGTGGIEVPQAARAGGRCRGRITK